MSEINRNGEIAELYTLWLLHNKEHYKYRFEWEKFVSVFFKEYHRVKDFKVALKSFRDDYVGKENVDLIAKKYVDLWEKNGIKSIVVDDYKNFDALKDIKNSLYFFYMGDLEILKNNVDEFACGIGSRKTDEKYGIWLRENLPKNKIIVSGLAKGPDTWSHIIAMHNKSKIVVFPPLDVFNVKHFDKYQKAILGRAKKDGLILMNVIPFSNIYSKTNYLNRNKWMAQISGETYVAYFNGIGGTLGQMCESAKLKRKIFVPKDVIELNKKFLKENKNFSGILDCIVNIKNKNKNLEKEK